MPKIRFIDPDFRRNNPSTNGLVDVVLRLLSAGWEVEVFAHEIEKELVGKVKHRKAPRIQLPIDQTHWGYFLYYNWQGIKDWMLGRSFSGITVSTGFLFPPAEIATVHFSHFNYIINALRYGRSQPFFIPITIIRLSSLLTEIVFLWNPWRTKMLAVSDSVAEDMVKFGAPWKDVRVLPNTVSVERFSPAVRLSNRVAARSEYGFTDTENVFLFSCMGHHFRKGFFLAVEAIAELRRRGHPVKMLLVGGYPRSLERLSRTLRKHHPDFSEWIVIAGMVDNAEYHYSAADALFFPSLSEAFSLVEIEASALGLPLYLTRHHGSEMILNDGVNGRFLPWDTIGMADVLEQEICGDRKSNTGDIGKALTQDQYYEQFLSQIEEFNPMD